jgi:hypothetical protein
MTTAVSSPLIAQELIMTVGAGTDIPDPNGESTGLHFVVAEAHIYPGRVKVIQPSPCPACGEILKKGSWGYPNLAVGDPRLHHRRHLADTPYSRQQIATGRSHATGLPRGVCRAKQFSPCAVDCGHPIKPGFLIERGAQGGWKHVLCPGICVRCEQPIKRGQKFSPRMPRPTRIGELPQHFGWKHATCNYVDLQARIARDTLANTLTQVARAQRRRENLAGIGPAFQRAPGDADATAVPPPGRISSNRLT